MIRLALATVLALLSGSLMAQDALPLMRESDRRLRADDESARFDMQIFDAARLVHTRSLIRLDKRFTERNVTVVRFTAPAAVRHVGLLIEDSGQAINDIWSYTPATKSLRRVAGSQKQNWFMGTEFTYEDFEDYKLDSYRFERREALVPCLEWARCEVVDATPVDAQEQRASGYSRKRYHLESASLYPVRIDYFDREGRLVKRLSTEQLQSFGRFVRPVAQTMHNLANNRRTRLLTTQRVIGRGLDDTLFTQRGLRSESD